VYVNLWVAFQKLLLFARRTLLHSSGKQQEEINVYKVVEKLSDSVFCVFTLTILP
jgi:uncharacterized membrane protein SirB2